MKISDEILQLQKRLEHLKALQMNCKHEWENPVYDPEIKQIMKYVEDYHIQTEYFYKEVPTGRYETIDRWSRTCKKCGLKQYTKESNIFEVKKEPKFR